MLSCLRIALHCFLPVQSNNFDTSLVYMRMALHTCGSCVQLGNAHRASVRSCNVVPRCLRTIGSHVCVYSHLYDLDTAHTCAHIVQLDTAHACVYFVQLITVHACPLVQLGTACIVLVCMRATLHIGA